MPLDPETFSTEAAGLRWRFHTTKRLGQFDIAVPGNDDGEPNAAALAHLETALERIDALYDAALQEAEKGWAERYKGPLRSREAWSLVRLFADPSGRLVLTLNESEFDIYCVWDVTVDDGQVTRVVQRAWVAFG